MTLLDDPERWLSILQSERPDGLNFSRVLGQGKSAVVFQATDTQGRDSAVKLYDADRLARYGLEVQQQRISRELSLVGHACTDLVGVHSGGELSLEGQSFPFVALELVDGSDLRDRVLAGRLPDSEVRRHLRSLVGAARFLESCDLCHRDIKVDNCRLRSDGSLVLLDLGVLRPVIGSDLTDTVDDPKTRYFLGTLRYAPPEFLLRQEGDTKDDWRAISIYQIGAVLYEMIHGVQLFSHVREPYAELVQAVLQSHPTVMRQDVGQDLITLTRNCLIKNPKERLKLVPWDSLPEIADATFAPPAEGPDLASRMRRAADLYSNTVEAKQQKWQQDAELKRQTQKRAVELASTALKLPVLAEVNPTLISAQRTVLLKVAENLKYQLPHPVWLCCRIKMSNESLETAQIDAVLLYGNFGRLDAVNRPRPVYEKTQEQIPKALSDLLDNHQFKPLLTTIAHEVPDETATVLKVRAWAEQSLEDYFEITSPDWEARIRDEQERIGAGSWMSVRNSKLFAVVGGKATELRLTMQR